MLVSFGTREHVRPDVRSSSRGSDLRTWQIGRMRNVQGRASDALASALDLVLPYAHAPGNLNGGGLFILTGFEVREFAVEICFEQFLQAQVSFSGCLTAER